MLAEACSPILTRRDDRSGVVIRLPPSGFFPTDLALTHRVPRDP